MTEINADTEKAPESGAKNMGKPGATMLTFAGAALVSGIIGTLIGIAMKGPMLVTGASWFFLLPIVGLPTIVGVIQRTTSDKPVTWYRTPALVFGILLGALVGLLFS